MKCKNCGAELNNGKCEYCGSDYREDEPYIVSTLYADGEVIAQIVNDSLLDASKIRGGLLHV